MKTTRSLSAAARWCKAAPQPVVLVPTMGALHAGHAKLIAEARRLAGPQGRVVVSIFVNPAQFGPAEDFLKYPQPFAADRELCAEAGVDLLFHPSSEAMYPRDFSTYIEESAVSKALCGASRPGHFRGVCTIVLKLFHVIRPQVAVFGLKDFQQCAVIRRMVRDFDLPVKIIAVSTVREADGLALSSRNRYLSPAERAEAPILRAALLAARKAWRGGETNAARLRKIMATHLATAPLARPDYLEIADAQTLQPIDKVGRNSVLALAVFFGKTRLIDNVWLR